MADTCCDDTFWQEQLTAAKAAATAYSTAILQLSTGAIQSYTLETGQTRQVVTKANLTELRNTLTGLMDLVSTLEARLCGASVIGIPGF